MQVKTQTITTYVANDGTVFNTLNECQMYEKSKLPYYKRMAVEQEFMWYEDNRDELHACGNDYSDLTEELKAYSCRVIIDALETEIESLQLRNQELAAEKEVLLNHMTTIRNCTTSPAIASLTRVVLERMAQGGGK